MSDPGDPAQHPLTAEMAASVADAMFALSTPSRVRILSLLRHRPHTVGELMAATDMEQSAVSHQLRVLRDHRLVIAERDGRRRVYALNDEHVAALLDEAIGHAAHLRDPASTKRPSRRRLRRAG